MFRRTLILATRQFSTQGPQTFRILGLQQIAIGGLEKEKLSHLWGNLLGVPRIGNYRSESENVDEDIYLLGEGQTGVEVDLMQPIDPNKCRSYRACTRNEYSKG